MNDNHSGKRGGFGGLGGGGWPGAHHGARQKSKKWCAAVRFGARCAGGLGNKLRIISCEFALCRRCPHCALTGGFWRRGDSAGGGTGGTVPCDALRQVSHGATGLAAWSYLGKWAKTGGKMKKRRIMSHDSRRSGVNRWPGDGCGNRSMRHGDATVSHGGSRQKAVGRRK